MTFNPKIEELKAINRLIRRVSGQLSTYLSTHGAYEFVKKVEILENLVDGYDVRFRTMSGKVYLLINEIEIGQLHVGGNDIHIAKEYMFSVSHKDKTNHKSLQFQSSRIIKLSTVINRLIATKIDFHNPTDEIRAEGIKTARAVLEQIQFLLS